MTVLCFVHAGGRMNGALRHLPCAACGPRSRQDDLLIALSIFVVCFVLFAR